MSVRSKRGLRAYLKREQLKQKLYWVLAAAVSIGFGLLLIVLIANFGNFMIR